MLQRLRDFTAPFSILLFSLVSVATYAQRAPIRVMPVRTPPLRFASTAGPIRSVPGKGIRTGVRFGFTVNQSHAKSGHHVAPQSADQLGFGGGFPLSVQDLLNITPSSGFNWQHVNAINEDLPIKALIDPVTQLEVAQAERLLRLTGGMVPAGTGGLYYVPSESEEATTPEQPEHPQTEPPQSQVIVLQQAPAQPPHQASEQLAPQAEVPHQNGLVLVLHNGNRINVFAFTRDKDHIVYITPDGSRLSVPETALDYTATLRANREQGTFLQLPF